MNYTVCGCYVFKKNIVCVLCDIFFLLAYAEADILGIPPHMIRLDEKYFIYIYIYIICILFFIILSAEQF